jgi:hypothetical protein
MFSQSGTSSDRTEVAGPADAGIGGLTKPDGRGIVDCMIVQLVKFVYQ